MTPRFPTAREVVRVAHGAGYVTFALGVLGSVLAALLWWPLSSPLALGLAIFGGLAVGYGIFAVGAARVAHWAIEADAPLAILRDETTRVRNATALATDGEGNGGDHGDA